MVRRVSLLVVIVGLLGVACGGGGSSDARRTTTTSVPPTTTVLGEAERLLVLVDLEVERPEGELTAAEFQAQRDRIDAAMDELLRDLGDHGEVARRLPETAQLAVSVDREGEMILSTHPLVGNVGGEAPEGATGRTPTTTVPATGTATTGAPPDRTTTTPPVAQPGTTAATTPGERRSLIVTVNVGWTPESQLSAEAIASQRARIEGAQDQVVLDLGAHGQLSLRLTESAQMVVAADDEGRLILAGHPLVAGVDDNQAETPGAAG